MRSTIRLFKAVPVDESARANEIDGKKQKEINERTIPHGFVIDPAVVASKNGSELDGIISTAIKELGLTGEQMNASFHKSWKKVKESSNCQLVMEQMVHYMTTYGFESMGIYSEESVYIPNEELDVPGLEGAIPLVVIRGLTGDEMMDKLLALLSAGIAFKEDTVRDIVDVATFLQIDGSKIGSVANKEAKAMLYDYLDIIPPDPVEFLRFAIYKVTGRPVLIKSDALIGTVKEGNAMQAINLFERYDERHGFNKLASIFNRFKPLFLALRTNSAMKKHVNKISRLSKKYHVPMKTDYLNQVTAVIKKGDEVDMHVLGKRLEKANFFRKARLAKALQFRLLEPSSIMYTVRNGKAYSTAFDPVAPNAVEPVLEAVLESMEKDMAGIEGKKIYVPEHVSYALPTTEKQFTGNMPSGSSVVIDGGLLVGIHWKNVEDHRVDLDLSLLGTDEKFGWDAGYRDGKGSILFSGDVTDAKGEGASEMFHVRDLSEGKYILVVNYFNYDEKVPAPCDVFVAKSKPLDDLPKNHAVNPNDVVCKARTTIDKDQHILGMLIVDGGKASFYFSETNIGNSRSIRMNDYTNHALDYLVTFYSNPIRLVSMLERAGAEVTSDPERRDNCDIDLSVEAIDKESFLSIVRS